MTASLALVIEDDEDLAEIFSLTLQEAEFDVEIIKDGQAALARLATITPALVVLDLHLPRISGQAILNHIRADSRLADIRVMLATADAVLADSLRHEADLVLLKPISPNQLRDLARRLHPPDIIG